jgi:hypothetical protein
MDEKTISFALTQGNHIQRRGQVVVLEKGRTWGNASDNEHSLHWSLVPGLGL